MNFYIIWALTICIGIFSDFEPIPHFIGLIVLGVCYTIYRGYMNFVIETKIKSRELTFIPTKTKNTSLFAYPILLIILIGLIISDPTYAQPEFLKTFSLVPLFAFWPIWLDSIIHQKWHNGILMSSEFISFGTHNKKHKWKEVKQMEIQDLSLSITIDNKKKVFSINQNNLATVKSWISKLSNHKNQ